MRSLPRVTFGSRRARRLAERALAGTLSPSKERALVRCLEASPEDREAYGALSVYLRALEGGAERELTSGQSERILDRVLEATTSSGAAARASGVVEDGGLGVLDRLLRFGSLARPASTAAAVALVVLVPVLALVLAPREATAPSVSARGASVSPAAGRPALRALCVRAGRIVPPPALVAGEREPLDARCLEDDELQLVLTAPSRQDHLLVVGLLEAADGTRRELHYFPVPPTGLSGPAPHGAVDLPLGESVRLEVNHAPGRLRILALFSSDPIDARTVFAYLAAAGGRPRDLLAAEGTGVALAEQRVAIERKTR
jgi:hypothetical protein